MLNLAPAVRRKILVASAVVIVSGLVAFGAMARNGWLPQTDPLTGKKTGWFGRPALNNTAGNPLVEPPLPTSTPQLAKEYIYAGSRMLAVEDANASAAPPADLAVWRPSTGYWYVLGGQSVQWGATFNTVQDVPVPGDYDNDGKTDFSVFRPGTGSWYIVRSSDGSNFAYNFGQNGDKTAPADYDGDGKTDAAIVRKDYPASGQTTFFIQFSSTGSYTGYQFGINGDKPTSADFDGDGRADLGVWRDADATFYFAKSSGNYQTYGGIACGAAGDVPVPADYDGDGKADAAVRSGSTWKIMQSSTNTLATIAWNYTGSVEVPNDYDGDGKVDIAVWDGGSGGIWSIRQSASLNANNGLRQVSWGSNGDVPVPAFYRR